MGMGETRRGGEKRESCSNGGGQIEVDLASCQSCNELAAAGARCWLSSPMAKGELTASQSGHKLLVCWPSKPL